MKRYPVFHPILFAAYAVLAIVATNPTHIFFNLAIRSLLVVLAVTVLVMLALKFILHDWHRAGLLTSLGIFLLLYYGHIYRLTKAWVPSEFQLAHHLLLFGCLVLLFGFVGSGWVWKRVRPHIITGFLDIIAVVALVFPLRTIVMLAIIASRDPLTNWTRPINIGQEDTPRLSAEQRPDIYYIIADGYARADVLQEIYHFDNSAFIQFLEEQGFYVASNSQSNYIQTSLSLPSSLNFEYLDYLEAMGKDSWNRDPATELITNSKARALLSDIGYQFVSFSSGFFYTEIRNADAYLSPYAININEFEQLLLGTSAAEILVKLNVLDMPSFEYETHRKRIEYTFDQLGHMPDTANPKFVFAHIITPHPPFIFDQNGQPVEPDQAYSIGDGTSFEGSPEEYAQGYINQVKYINSKLEQAIVAILANSKTPPIIILQADHGPGIYLDWDSVEKTCTWERTSILNAYHLPGDGAAHLYSSISPVNSFRVVFNTYFGAHLALLEDKSYYSNLTQPYNFIDVTSRSKTPCAVP